jgi:hypothetical protein
MMKYRHTGQVEDLQRSILLAREATSNVNSSNNLYTGMLGSLNVYLMMNYEQTGLLVDFDEAERSVEAMHRDHPNRVLLLDEVNETCMRRC